MFQSIVHDLMDALDHRKYEAIQLTFKQVIRICIVIVVIIVSWLMLLYIVVWSYCKWTRVCAILYYFYFLWFGEQLFFLNYVKSWCYHRFIISRITHHFVLKVNNHQWMLLAANVSVRWCGLWCVSEINGFPMLY